MKPLNNQTPLERLKNAKEDNAQIMQYYFELNSEEKNNDNDESNLTNSYEFYFFDNYLKLISGSIIRQKTSSQR